MSKEPGQLAYEAWVPDAYPWENTPHKGRWAAVESAIRADESAKGDERERELLMTEWRPIDTAPKDGRQILVARKYECGYDHKLMGTDFWREGSWYRSRRQMQPTHWMPLPAPPPP